MSDNTTDYDDYHTPYNDTTLYVENSQGIYHLIIIRMLYITGYIIICPLGLVLNLLVIIAGICHHHQSVTAKCVLALGITHLICSAFLPFQILYSWYHFNWHHGIVLCKLSSYVFYASLFSTAGILTVWNVAEKCKGRHCIQFKHLLVVLIMSSWTFAAVLSFPSLFSRQLQYTALGGQCVDDYNFRISDSIITYFKQNGGAHGRNGLDEPDREKTKRDGKSLLTIIVCYRLILGILIPAFLIGISRSYQRHGIKKNLKRIMCLINVAYFVCWTPLLITAFLQVVIKEFDPSSYGLPVTTVLAAAHCCVNPVIYLMASNDIKMRWMKQAKESNQLTEDCI